MDNISVLEALKQALRRLPGVGPKSASRMAYHLLERDREGARQIAQALTNAVERIVHCKRCNNLSETELCPICVSARRDKSLLCVVESPSDLVSLDQSGVYNGLYFVLMGRLSPLDGVGPRDIGLEKLLARATAGEVAEVVLATNFTNEGEATAHYIAELLRSRNVRVSRIARGVPLGGELEYVDAGTLSQALLDRRGM